MLNDKLLKDKHKTIIQSLSDEGRGVGRSENGKTIFLDNALSNEEVEYVVNKRRKNFIEGMAVNIINDSPLRVVPKCKSFLECGGCSLQHMQHDAQIEHKQQTLLSQLKHFGSNVIPKAILEPITGSEFGYRHKARLGVKYVTKKNQVLVGFREKSTNFIVDMNSCEVLHPTIGKSIDELKLLITSLKAFNVIPQIEVALGDLDAALIFRNLQPLEQDDLEKLILFGQNKNINIYIQPKGLDSIKKIWPLKDLNEDKDRLYYKLPDYNITMAFHPADFIQVNPSINKKMIAKAIELLELSSEDIVLDLFCGLGNFTLPLALKTKFVIGVEGASEMVLRGMENAKLNNIANVEFHEANLMADLRAAKWLRQDITKVLLDPPRSGAEAILKDLASLNVSKILYVSCNPATLAKDAGILVNQYGFVLEKTLVLDMFPHTEHVESMALFTRKV